MEQAQKNSTRKKFLLLGGALISAITFSKYFNAAKKTNAIACGETTTVKMLTQDGRVVEVEKKLLASSDKKISNEELQQWIKK